MGTPALATRRRRTHATCAAGLVARRVLGRRVVSTESASRADMRPHVTLCQMPHAAAKLVTSYAPLALHCKAGAVPNDAAFAGATIARLTAQHACLATTVGRRGERRVGTEAWRLVTRGFSVRGPRLWVDGFKSDAWQIASVSSAEPPRRVAHCARQPPIPPMGEVMGGRAGPWEVRRGAPAYKLASRCYAELGWPRRHCQAWGALFLASVANEAGLDAPNGPILIAVSCSQP